MWRYCDMVQILFEYYDMETQKMSICSNHDIPSHICCDMETQKV